MNNPNQFQKTYINSATTTTPFTGNGVLHSVVINTTAAGAITLKDNGTTFAVIAASPAIGQRFEYDCVVSQDLTVVTAAASDITVTWTKA